MKAPWGVAAAGRVAANNGSALFASVSVPIEAAARLTAPVNARAESVRTSGSFRCDGEAREGNQVAQALGGLQADSRGGRKVFAARVAAKCHNNPLLVLDERQRLNGKLQPRAATTFPGAQADSTATYLISLARPTEQRAGSFRNQQENL